MGSNSPKCTCKYCGSENGKPFKYWTALNARPVSSERTEYTGITEYTEGICFSCRWKAHTKLLIAGLVILAVTVPLELFLPKSIPAWIFTILGILLFIGICCTVVGLTPKNGTDMLIEEAKKKNPDSKLHYLKPKV